METILKIEKLAFTIFVAISGTILIACSSESDADGEGKGTENAYKATGTVDGHEYVDLGLSVSWATCNIGSNDIYEEGDEYFWGDPSGKGNFESMQTYNFPTPPINGTSYDIAYMKWGKQWSLPTIDQVNELTDKCTFQKCYLNGKEGAKITGPNGNSLFLPAVTTHFCYDFKPPYTPKLNDHEINYMFAGESFTDGSKCDGFSMKYIAPHFVTSYCNRFECQTWAVRPVTKYGATGKDNHNNNNGDNNAGGSTGGGNSSSYEKPDIAFDDFTAYQTKLKVVYKIYNKDKANVTSAKVYYGTSSNPTKSLSATVAGVLITANISGLNKGTTYYVKCVATGKGGTTTTETTKVITNY